MTNQQGERQESTCPLIPIHGPRDARAHTLTHTQMKRSQVLWRKNPAHSIVCLVVETLVSNQENLKQREVIYGHLHLASIDSEF